MRQVVDDTLRGLARIMRKKATNAERRMWSKLRDGRLGGLKFRRQAPIGRAIADFVCYEHKLIVEVEDMVWQRQLYGLRHFLLKNLAQALGEALVTDIDFRPMPKRRRPQRAETARPTVDASGIGDPVMAMLYQQSKKRGTA